MPGTPQLPPRPPPPRSVGDAVVAWTRWVGVGRLVAAACSVMVVVGGVVWLVRAPAVPAESTLPVTSAGAPAATLAPPVTTVGVPPDGNGSAAPASTSPSPILVHVAGAVVVPGVHAVTGSARVADAVAAAGGATAEGDLDGLNLAAPLTDGERVYVPSAGEVDPASVPAGGVPAAGPAGSSPAVPTGPLDLNSATPADLESLPGVGPATAAAIVDDRDRNGPFATVDDLDRVSGIGPAKLAALRDLVTV